MDWNRPGKLIRPNPDWEEDLFQTVVVGPAELARLKSYTEDVKKKKPKKECCCQDFNRPGVAPLMTLNNGRTIPSLGLGTFIGYDEKGVPLPIENLDTQRAVEAAIDAGYRLIDTAAKYNNEDQVGAAINYKISQGVVRREDLFIITKLSNYCHAKDAVVPALKRSLKRLCLEYVDLYLIHWPVGLLLSNYCHAKDAVVPALKRSLKRLCLEYVDLYLIHWPVGLLEDGSYDERDYIETWEGMIEARVRGLTKSIGVSNFNQHQLDRIITMSRVKPAAVEIEVNLNLQQSSLISFCRSQDIAVIGYRPFGSLFHGRAAPDAPQPRTDALALIRLSDRYYKTVAQVALRYLIELGVIPIPKSLQPHRIEMNIEVFDFQLTKVERAFLSGYEKGYRTMAAKFWQNAPHYPFKK